MGTMTNRPDCYNASVVLDNNLAEGRGGKVATHIGNQTYTFSNSASLPTAPATR